MKKFSLIVGLFWLVSLVVFIVNKRGYNKGYSIGYVEGYESGEEDCCMSCSLNHIDMESD